MNPAYIIMFISVSLPNTDSQRPMPCPPGYPWMRFEDACYRFFNETLPWDNAQLVCGDYQAHLMEIDSPAEYTFLVSQWTKRKLDAVWLGGTDMQEEGTFRWMSTNNTIGKFLPWYYGQPNNADKGEGCLAICTSRIEMFDDECEFGKSVVCERNPWDNYTINDRCKNGWEDLNDGGNCYFYMNLKVGWFDAVSMCRGIGAYLVEINSQTEQISVSSFFRWRGLRGGWLGASDIIDEGVWQWQSDRRIITGYKLWSETNPSNTGDYEHCMAVHNESNYEWDDVNCDMQLTFLCEKRAV